MLKLLGAHFVISGAATSGFLKSRRLNKRSLNLNRLISSLVLLDREISYGKKGIKDALIFIGNSENMPLFTVLSEKIGEFSVCEAFSYSIENCDMCFSASDKSILYDFFSSLGCLDAQSQIKSIIHTRELLIIAQNDACEYYKRYGRLYRSTGLLLGILFALILF